MIISHKHRFVFIKTRKTAGTSIEAVLARQCGPGDILTPLVPPVAGHAARNDRGRWIPLRETVEALALGDWAAMHATASHWRDRRRYFKHIPARLVRARLGEKTWRGYTTFCVDRNPFDKTVSHFHMLRARGVVTDFDDYLDRGDLCWNAPLYTDSAGGVMVDHVLAYEDLDTAFGRLMQRLGVPFAGRIGVRAKSDSRPDDARYQDLIAPRQRARLERAFAEELDLHGYAF